MNKTCGLIVTHQPNLSVLRDTVVSLALSVDEIFIYANASDSTDMSFQDLEIGVKISAFYSSENTGIAEAHNWLLSEAVSRGYAYAVISDQDTIYPDEFAGSLIKYFDNAPEVVAVCPGWIDQNLGRSGKYPGQYVFAPNGFLKIDRREDGAIKIAHAIASGMVIRLSLLQQVGLMRADLFIDWVVNEWGWRANRLGFTVLGVPSVKIEHTLGDETVSILGRNFVARSSTRNYYIVRNALNLMLSKSIPVGAKVYLFRKVIHHSIFCFLASKNKIAELRMISKAYWHGISGLLGRMR